MTTAKLLGSRCQSPIQVNHKTQFHVEYSRNLNFVYSDAILWKHGRNNKYMLFDKPRKVQILTR